MSLDVYLNSSETIDEECICSCCDNIHIRKSPSCVYRANITHNLGKMANAAGIYTPLWRPEEMAAVIARDLIWVLEDGLKKLIKDPDEYEKYNSPNGYGMYEHFVEFVSEYLEACKKFPEALIEVSR